MISRDLKNRLLDASLRGNAYTSPNATYLALFTTPITPAVNPTSTGMVGSEVVGADYARQAISFSQPLDGVTRNNLLVTFPPAGIGGWGVVSHWAIFTAPTAGQMLFYGAFDAPWLVDAGKVVTVSPARITVRLG